MTVAALPPNAAGMEVIGRQLNLPASYGSPNRVLSWAEVEQKLIESKTYWLATTRPDGRPHVMPVWGVWMDRAFPGSICASMLWSPIELHPKAITARSASPITPCPQLARPSE